jgi:hypothetical protein
MDDIGLDWGTAEVSDGRLSVAFTEKPSKDWTGRFEAVIDRLARGGTGWGAIDVAKKKLHVDAVEPGAEADLRHFLDSALLQANAARDDDGAGEDADSGRSEQDQSQTDAFRAFADERD